MKMLILNVDLLGLSTCKVSKDDLSKKEKNHKTNN